MNEFKKNILRTVIEYDIPPDPEPLTRYCYQGIWNADDTIHVPPGGNIVYTDEFGIEQSIQDIVLEDGIISVMSSTVPVTFGVSVQTCP